MRNLIGKMVSLQLGLLAVTKDKVSGMVDELIRAGEVSQDEGKKLVEDIVERGEKSRQEMRAEVDRTVSDLLRRMNIPTRAEIDAIREDMIEMRDEIDRILAQNNLTETKGV